MSDPAASVIDLPWPSNKLSPNARIHWSYRHRAVKAARTGAAWATRAVVVPGSFNAETAIRISTTFFPPDHRSYDEDNLKARCKAIYDGIADAIGVDDRHFRHQAVKFGEPVKGGMVRVQIEQADTWEHISEAAARVFASVSEPKRGAA